MQIEEGVLYPSGESFQRNRASYQISIPPEFFIFRLIRQASKPRTVQSLVYPNEVNEWYSCGKVVYFIEV